MTPDETNRPPSFEAERSDGDALATPVVLVADGDPSVTDEIATVLRDEYTVRSAYDSADALASLDPDVSVALLDPDIGGLSARRVLDRVRTAAADCQVAALTDDAVDLERTAFDDYLVKPVAPDRLRETVDRLGRRATYRTTLEAYYRTATRRAEAETDDERAELDDRLSRLDERLDEVFGTLDGAEAYDAALRELDVDP